jgi:hypothetical protein
MILMIDSLSLSIINHQSILNSQPMSLEEGAPHLKVVFIVQVYC